MDMTTQPSLRETLQWVMAQPTVSEERKLATLRVMRTEGIGSDRAQAMLGELIAEAGHYAERGAQAAAAELAQVSEWLDVQEHDPARSIAGHAVAHAQWRMGEIVAEYKDEMTALSHAEEATEEAEDDAALAAIKASL